MRIPLPCNFGDSAKCKVQWKTSALKGRVMVLKAGRNGIYVFLLQKRFLA